MRNTRRQLPQGRQCFRLAQFLGHGRLSKALLCGKLFSGRGARAPPTAPARGGGAGPGPRAAGGCDGATQNDPDGAVGGHREAARRGSRVRFDTEYLSLEQDDDGVTATVREPPRLSRALIMIDPSASTATWASTQSCCRRVLRR